MPAEVVTVNGREYRLTSRPTVVITVDGCQPVYLDDGLARGLMPRLRRMLADGGSYGLASPTVAGVVRQPVFGRGPRGVRRRP